MGGWELEAEVSQESRETSVRGFEVVATRSGCWVSCDPVTDQGASTAEPSVLRSGSQKWELSAGSCGSLSPWPADAEVALGLSWSSLCMRLCLDSLSFKDTSHTGP